MTEYHKTLHRLFDLARFGEKLDLSTPQALNAALGQPLGCYRNVLVGGTNGKGSTAACLEALLRAAGLRVGVFTSPHLMSFRERIRIDGAEISEALVCRLADEVLSAAGALRPSFFETVWAMAAAAFRVEGVDVAIWEVGLGGRLDATNTCDPEVSMVTSIGLDHTHVLGDTLDAIAGEKAGIFREGRPALTGATGEGLAAVQRAWPAVVSAPPFDGPLPLPGAHQRRNAGLAIAGAKALGVAVDPGALAHVSWPGRAEIVRGVLLDCAHNGHAAEALAAWLEGRFARLHVIFGAMQGKDLGPLVAPLRALADSVTLVTPKYPRRVEAEALKAYFPNGEVIEDVAQALAAAPSDAQTLVVGSCFLVGEARAALLGVPFPEAGIVTLAR